MEIGTLMLIEFSAFFGGLLAFGFHQLWSLKKLDRLDREKRAAAGEGADVDLSPPPMPGWMTRR
ncbi:MAG: hypothetical protein HEQ16_06275 [Bosea sp.]|nr:hypothetical protein [Bosea sp. (in: a-proteobacteria)]